MLAMRELKQVKIFSCLGEQDLQWLSQQIADVHLEPGEYLIHEGEPTSFFVLLEGIAEVTKEVMGRRTEVSLHSAGDFFGELAILMATAAPASVCAKTNCRFARLDPQDLQELIRRSAECSALIMQTLNERVQMVQKYMLQLPSSRVQIIGSKFDASCRDIRTFLSTNQIPYQWTDSDRSRQSGFAATSHGDVSPSIIVDDVHTVSRPPTVRKVAESLGFQTIPKLKRYDTVIIGGGPAGLAAAVYGASEGLSVLLRAQSSRWAGWHPSLGSKIISGFPMGYQVET